MEDGDGRGGTRACPSRSRSQQTAVVWESSSPASGGEKQPLPNPQQEAGAFFFLPAGLLKVINAFTQ